MTDWNGDGVAPALWDLVRVTVVVPAYAVGFAERVTVTVPTWDAGFADRVTVKTPAGVPAATDFDFAERVCVTVVVMLIVRSPLSIVVAMSLREISLLETSLVKVVCMWWVVVTVTVTSLTAILLYAAYTD